MKTALRILLPILVLVLGAFGAKALIDSRPEVVPEPPPVVLPTVRTLSLQLGDTQVLVPTQGTVTPRTETDLVAEVSGRVTAISPRLVAGGFFEEGDVLLELDDTDYRLALAQAELTVAQAKRRLAEEEADAEVARREWDELGEGEATPLTLREPQLDEARANLAAAEAARAMAERNLERTKLRAIYRGRVRTKQVDLGQYVMAGKVVARVYAIDSAEVRLPLPDDQLAFIDLPLGFAQEAEDAHGPLVDLSAEFGGRIHHWSGRIVRVEGEIDPRTRMLMAVARVDDPYGLAGSSMSSNGSAGGDASGGTEAAGHGETNGNGEHGATLHTGEPAPPLAVGMFVHASIHGRTLPDVYVLPRVALRDGPQVFAIDADETLRMLDVELVRSGRDEVVVRGAQLVNGMEVVSSPLEIVTEGMQVRHLGADE